MQEARVLSYFGYDAVLYCDFLYEERPAGPAGAEVLRPKVYMEVSMGGSAVAVRLCPRPLRRFRLAACTQPLHSFGKMASQMPKLLEDFLDYHGQLGIEHFTIFDADGTLEEPLKRYKGAVEARELMSSSYTFFYKNDMVS